MDTAVALVKSYLELCGYFVLAEIPVRKADGGRYVDVTDVDIIGIRFPHAHEPPKAPRLPLDIFLGHDAALDTSDEVVDVVVGEVKEGRARVNPALRREETIAFALRRVGCCPEEKIQDHARMIARHGSLLMRMAGGTRCRVRLVVFAGHGQAVPDTIQNVSLGHCADYISLRLDEARELFAGVHLKDPVLGLFLLQQKTASVQNG